MKRYEKDLKVLKNKWNMDIQIKANLNGFSVGQVYGPPWAKVINPNT